MDPNKGAPDPNAVTIRDFSTKYMPTWCPGCGDFAVWTGIKMALSALNIYPTKVVLAFDIGCNGNMADKINAYVFKGLHGRVLPLAAGIALANKDIPVIAIAGDGGTFDEGMHHFIHSIRSNYNVTFILHNNCDFALTTGQATPTTPKGTKMNSSPYGTIENRLNPIQLALTSTASFIGRAYTGDMKHIAEVIKAGIAHDGFSFIEVLQHCPTYNKFLDQAYYKERVYKVEEDPAGWDVTNKENLYKLAGYEQERIPMGVLYQEKDSVGFLNRLEHLKNEQKPLKDLVEKQDISEILQSFK